MKELPGEPGRSTGPSDGDPLEVTKLRTEAESKEYSEAAEDCDLLCRWPSPSGRSTSTPEPLPRCRGSTGEGRETSIKSAIRTRTEGRSFKLQCRVFGNSFGPGPRRDRSTHLESQSIHYSRSPERLSTANPRSAAANLIASSLPYITQSFIETPM